MKETITQSLLTSILNIIDENNKDLLYFDLNATIEGHIDEIINHYEEEISQLQFRAEMAFDDGYEAALEEVEDSIDKIRRFNK